MNTTYEYTKKITVQEIEALMSAALQGMTYWADEASIIDVSDEDSGIYTSQAFTYGYAIEIHDAEEDKTHKLTLHKLLKGLSMTDNLDLESYDMYDAERVVQRALFGKEVYA